MPLVASSGAMSARSFGFFSATGSYWIATLGGANTDVGNGIAVDSSGNIHVVGTTDSAGAGNSDILVTKYNDLGAIQWQRVLGGASADAGNGIALDSSGNVYITGQTQSQGLGSNDVVIAKYDSSGTIQWQRRLGNTTGDIGRGIAVDASGNVFIAGSESSQTSVTIAKYDTSGTFQWARKLNNTGGLDDGYGVSLDSSGNAYLVGWSITSALIAKYDTSGAIQWQRVLSGGSTNEFRGVDVDSSGNSYVTGLAGGSNILIAKYDTSGTISWQRTLTGAGTEFGWGVAVDTSGNAYISGQTNSEGAGGIDAVIAKYDTSGVLQWQRVLGGSGSDYGYGVSVDNAGSVYVAGQTTSSGAGGGDVLIFKIPDDGSLTGSYGPFTYAVSTLTAATASLTPSTSTFTDSASDLISATATLTSATSTLTSTVTTI